MLGARLARGARLVLGDRQALHPRRASPEPGYTELQRLVTQEGTDGMWGQEVTQTGQDMAGVCLFSSSASCICIVRDQTSSAAQGGAWMGR